MFPLKTLVLAAIIAIAFGPRVEACAMPEHTHTVAALPAAEQPPATPSATKDVGEEASASAQPSDIASASQPTSRVLER